MSFHEKRSLFSLFAHLILALIFILIAAPQEPFTPQRWGLAFLILVPAGIAVQILLTILVAILNKAATREDPPKRDDERDRFISLKATRNSYLAFSAGFLAGMAMLAFGQPVSSLLVALGAACFAASIANDISRFVYYRRGI